MLTTDFYKWVPGSEPALFLQLSQVKPRIMDQSFGAALDPEGRRIAVFVDNALTIFDVRTKKIVLHVSEHEIFQRLRLHPDGWTSDDGLVWNPQGSAVAVTMGTNANRDSSSGEAPAMCVLIRQDKSVTRLGPGSPIAWVTPNILLCKQERPFNLDLVRPILIDANTRRVTARGPYGRGVGWDGTHVLLGRVHQMDVISKDLRTTLRRVPIEDLDLMDSLQNIVGIPYSEVR